jgi:5-carboxymethyl-2-hydroxymuconate isomerase
MPHLRLEHSSDLPAETASEALLLELHGILARDGGIPIANCKSRVVECRRYAVGDGSGEESFVHLEVAFLEGRDDEVYLRIGEALLARLLTAYRTVERELQITVELRDIARRGYFKHPGGTL